jgi:hypothetical protein
MKKLILVGITLLLICSFGISQPLPKKATIGRPRITGYKSESEIQEIIKTRLYLKAKKGPFWVVYSDRAGSITLDKPNGTKQVATLKFMEQVKVAEAVDDWLHVFTDDVQIWPKISSNAKDLGWVKIDKLLIHDKCLFKDKRLVTSKAIILANADDLKSIASDKGELKLSKKIYLDPDMRLPSDMVARTYDIYFIYKKTDKAVLLAKTDIIHQETDMLGWMSRQSTTPWDHRVCMELNWSDSAYREYKGIPISVFSEREQANKFRLTGDSLGAIRSRYLEAKRDSGFIKRSPVLEIKNNLKRVGTIANLSSSEEKQLANLQDKLQKVIDVIENINILFVIDGSDNMEPYYRPIKDGIISFIQNKAESSKNKINWGALIYRDFDNGTSFQMKKLSSDYTEVTSFLNEVKCYSNKKGAIPAVYSGLCEGIRNAGFLANQSNFIILIGAGSNSKSDPNGETPDQVADLLTKYQISMVGFQAYRGDKQEYENFMPKIIDMVRLSACKLSKTSDMNDCKKYIKFEEIEMEQSALHPDEAKYISSYILKYKNFDKSSADQESFMPYSSICCFSKKGQIGYEYLQKSIESTIDNYNKRINTQKDIIEDALYRPSGDWTTALEDKLKQMDFTNDQIRQLKNFRAIMVSGWTADTIIGKRNPCYRPIAFLSFNELLEILGTSSKLGLDRPKSERREAFQEALIEKCKLVLGEQKNQNITSVIKEYSLDEVWNIIFGIPFSDPELGKIKIGKITSKLFSIDKLDRFSEHVQKNSENLARLMGSSNPYSFRSNDQTFYWIPLEDLP